MRGHKTENKSEAKNYRDPKKWKTRGFLLTWILMIVFASLTFVDFWFFPIYLFYVFKFVVEIVPSYFHEESEVPKS